MKMNVESFNLDHTKVKAPYIRVADKKTGEHGMSLSNMMFASNNLIKSIWICQVYIL